MCRRRACLKCKQMSLVIVAESPGSARFPRMSKSFTVKLVLLYALKNIGVPLNKTLLVKETFDLSSVLKTVVFKF